MGLLLLPIRALDSSGDPLSGAKLKFYAAGTSTPKSAYPTEADAVADTSGATTFTADGNGLFAAVYGDNDADYKIELTDSSDTQIWEEDDVPVIKPTVATRIKQGFRTPLDYGAEGDGSTNDYTAIQAAITAAVADGTYVVDLLGFTYRCDSGLVLDSGIRLQNGTLDFTSAGTVSALKLQGSVGTQVVLSGNLTIGDTSFSTADTSGVVADQWVKLGSTGQWGAGTSQDLGFLMKARSVTASTSVTTHGRSPITLSTANTASYRPLTQKSGVVLEDLTIINPQTGSTSNSVLIDIADDVVIRNCTFDTFPAYGVECRLATNVLIDGCRFNGGSATTSRGVGIRELSKDVRVTDCKFYDMDYGIEIGVKPSTAEEGVCMDIMVDKCRVYGATTVGIYSNDNVFGLSILDNQVEGYDGTQTDLGISCDSGAVTIRGNTVRQTVDIGITVIDKISTAAVQEYTLTIDDNEVYDCESTDCALKFETAISSGGAARSIVTRNHINSSAGAGIRTGVTLISYLGATVTHICDNDLNSIAGKCIEVDTFHQGDINIIERNTVLQAGSDTSAVLHYDGAGATQKVTIHGNIFIKANDTTNPCIDINPSETNGYFTILGNYIENGTYGIDVGTTDEITEGFNIFIGQSTGDVNGTIDAAVGTGTGGTHGTFNVT